MKVRPQVAALIVLLLVMGFVYVLVGEAGVSTDAIKPTPTVSPTAAPAAASSGTADNWVETQDGTLTYMADPTLDVQAVYLVDTLDGMVAQFGVDTPAEDAAYPVLDLAQSIYDALKDSATSSDLTFSLDEPPAITRVGDTPVALFHVTLPPQEVATGAFAGRDLALAFAGTPERLGIFQYIFNGESNPVAYDDFLAWMSAHAADLVAPAAAPTAEATEPALEVTAEAPAATEEAAPVGTEAPDVAVTAEPEPVATEVALLPEATEEPAATAEPDAAMTQDASATEEVTGDWFEVADGALMYAADPSITAQISYTLVTADQLVDPEQYAALPEDPAEQPLAILQLLREGHEVQLADAGLVVDDDAYVGPNDTEVAGEPGAALRVVIAPQMVGDQSYPGVDQEIALFSRDDGWLLVITYMQRGESNTAVYDSYRAWLDDHMSELAELEAPAAESTAEATAEITIEAVVPTAEATEAAN